MLTGRMSRSPVPNRTRRSCSEQYTELTGSLVAASSGRNIAINGAMARATPEHIAARFWGPFCWNGSRRDGHLNEPFLHSAVLTVVSPQRCLWYSSCLAGTCSGTLVAVPCSLFAQSILHSAFRTLTLLVSCFLLFMGVSSHHFCYPLW